MPVALGDLGLGSDKVAVQTGLESLDDGDVACADCGDLTVFWSINGDKWKSRGSFFSQLEGCC